jgi:hypothetical protein
MNRRPPTTSATIELEPDTETPVGVLSDGRGQARRFSGWIELAAAIEDWRTSTARADTRQAANEAPDRRPATNTAQRNPREAIQ